ADNLPRDLIAVQNENEHLRNQLNQAQIALAASRIALAASRIGRFCDRLEYKRKIDEVGNKT
ncbi:unnamed protein product, partial [Rotaria sp. Silwood1]